MANSEHPATKHCMSLLQLKIANVVAFIVTIVMNFLGPRLGSMSLGEISDMYGTKLNPASGAFSIWGIIYILNALFLVYQFFWPKEDEALLLHDIGFWYIGACFFNSLWIVVFTQATTAAFWFGSFLIAGILFCLCRIYTNTDCWRATRVGGIMQRIIIDVHISMYASWVTVATVVNISITLGTVWSPSSGTASALAFTMLIVVLILDTYIVVTRRDTVWGLVLAWASFWISVAQRDDGTVFVGAVIACITSALVSVTIGVLTVMDVIKTMNAQSTQTSDDVEMKANA